MKLLRKNIIEYLLYTKWLYLTVISIYLVTFLIGLNMPVDNIDSIQDLHVPIKQKSFLSYFIHNSNIVLVSMGSVITFGILSVYLSALNGFILGNAIRITGEHLGSYSKTISMLFPHAIFEIPAIFTSCVLGLFLIRRIFILIRFKDEKILIWRDIKLFLFGGVLAFILLFFASILEYYVSPIFK